jgi:hypothetical protein
LQDRGGRVTRHGRGGEVAPGACSNVQQTTNFLWQLNFWRTRLAAPGSLFSFAILGVGMACVGPVINTLTTLQVNVTSGEGRTFQIGGARLAGPHWW